MHDDDAVPGDGVDETQDAATNPTPVGQPSDPRIAARWRAFEVGDFRAASAGLPLDGVAEAVRRRYEGPLQRALRFEPWLVAMAAAGAAAWVALFIWAQ